MSAGAASACAVQDGNTYRCRNTHWLSPVYGTLRPVSTWNPIMINFKHIFQLAKDAWLAEKIFDKIKIWFMPTGWRPNDVNKRMPLKEINNPENQIKYKTNNSNAMLIWSWFQHFIAGTMMFHMFMVMDIDNISLHDYLYGFFIIVHIFSFTSILDNSKYSIIGEFFKIVFGFSIIYFQNYLKLNSIHH